MTPPVQAVLFDLDGTLVDSAPDLAAAANGMRAARGLAPLPYAQLRPHAGSGARGLLWAAFGLRRDAPEYDSHKAEFLDLYAACMLDQARIFDGVPALLQALHQRTLRWGIVTNKAHRLAQPLAAALGLLDAAAVLVAGDTTPHIKPHPAPLLEAARRLAVDPRACVYVGDDARDMQAGRAAGMRVLAASWGYLGEGEDLGLWGADAVLPHPHAVLKALELA